MMTMTICEAIPNNVDTASTLVNLLFQVHLQFHPPSSPRAADGISCTHAHANIHIQTGIPVLRRTCRADFANQAVLGCVCPSCLTTVIMSSRHFDPMQTVKPGQVVGGDLRTPREASTTASPTQQPPPRPSARGDLTHRSLVAERRGSAATQTYRMQAAERRRELAARARRVNQPDSVLSPAFRPSSSSASGLPLSARSASADVRLSGVAVATPRPSEVGSGWRQREADVARQQQQAAEEQERNAGWRRWTGAPVPAPAKKEQSRAASSSPTRSLGLAPVPRAVPQQQLAAAVAGRSIDSSHAGRTPRFSRRGATPRDATQLRQHQVPQVAVERVTAESGQPTPAAGAGQRSRSRSPSIDADRYRSLLACGSYRAVLRASDVQHADKPRETQNARSYEILRELRQRVRAL